MPKSSPAISRISLSTPFRSYNTTSKDRSSRAKRLDDDLFDDIASGNKPRYKKSGANQITDVVDAPKTSPVRKLIRSNQESDQNEDQDETQEDNRPVRNRKPSAKLALIQQEAETGKGTPIKRRNLTSPASFNSIQINKRNAPTDLQQKTSSTKRSKIASQLEDQYEDDLARSPSISNTPTKKRVISTKQISNAVTSQTLQDDSMDLDVEVPIKVTKTQFLKEPLRPGESEAISIISKVVLEKLAGHRPVPLVHLDEEYASIKNILEATVTVGEGNSMVVIGARGTGKSATINKVLADLGKTQREYFHVVRLNAFIQTDDKLALREIWRQLGREMEVDEDAGKSYADTLTMLLALLSHPDEIMGENLGQVARSVIFIMDEFDLFASHSRQTLLYNLLDIAQARKAPIAVIGVTTKFDVKESLEKRVKSRFSHRYVHVPFPKSQSAFQDVCLAACSVQTDDLTFDERTELSRITSSFTQGKSSKALNPILDWNNAIKTLFSDRSIIDNRIIQHYHLNKSIPAALTSLLLPFANAVTNPTFSIPTLLHPSHLHPSTTTAATTTTPHLTAPSTTLPTILPHLSTLSLSLLIAACRTDIIHAAADLVSFPLAYAEYVDLAGKARVASAAAGQLVVGAAVGKVWGRQVARREWERLVALGLLVPLVEGRGDGVCRVEVRLEEIVGAAGDGMSALMVRWCRQI